MYSTSPLYSPCLGFYIFYLLCEILPQKKSSSSRFIMKVVSAMHMAFLTWPIQTLLSFLNVLACSYPSTPSWPHSLLPNMKISPYESTTATWLFPQDIFAMFWPGWTEGFCCLMSGLPLWNMVPHVYTKSMVIYTCPKLSGLHSAGTPSRTVWSARLANR